MFREFFADFGFDPIGTLGFIFIAIIKEKLVLGFLYETPRQPKVTYRNLAFIIDQNILWLQVSVHDITRVNEVQRCQTVVDDNLDVLIRQRVVFYVLHNVVEVILAVVHNQVDPISALYRRLVFACHNNVK